VDYLITDDAFDALTERHRTASGVEQLALAVEMAWQQRQRNSAQALERADEAERALCLLPDKAMRQRLTARLLLVRGEDRWLHQALDAAQALVDAALALFDAADDRIGRSDALQLAARIHQDGGRFKLRDAACAAAVQAADAAGDPLRSAYVEAWLALNTAFGAVELAAARWGTFLAEGAQSPVLALRAMACDALGVMALLRGNNQAAIAPLMQAVAGFRVTGQLRPLFAATGNVAVAFADLNDTESALAWTQDQLDIARATGWPRSLAQGLLQAGYRLCAVGQSEAGYALLLEAQGVVQRVPSRHTHAMMHGYLAEAEQARGCFDAALAHLNQQLEHALVLGSTQLQLQNHQLRARTQLQMGDAASAREAAHAALDIANVHRNEIAICKTLELLGDIHAGRDLPPPPSMSEPNAALHYLHAALALSEQMAGFFPPSSLFSALAARYADVEDHRQAYAFALRADQAHKREHSDMATRRGMALEVRYQTDSAKALALHHAQLAEEQARRATALADTGAVLERLGTIGQEITAHLSDEHVFAALNRHMHGLLDVASMSIFLLSADGRQLVRSFGMEGSRPLPARVIAIDDAQAHTAECARQRSELLIDLRPSMQPAGRVEPGTLATMSALYFPLLAGDRLLGVITLQSLRPDAYGERERMILRTLCAYGGIALDNARVYGQLASTLDALHQAQADLLGKNQALEQANTSLAEQSLTDSLTGLRNRRYLLQHLGTDVELCLRSYARASPTLPSDADMAFVLIDLDHFKLVNDRHGHAAGDSVLVQLRARLESVCREADYLVRWGGEEFLVVARQTSRELAPHLAERIRRAIGSEPFDIAAGKLPMTASVGFACFPFLKLQPDAYSWEEVVALADYALYDAKHAGRNAWRGLVPGTQPREAQADGPKELDIPAMLDAGEVTVFDADTLARLASSGCLPTVPGSLSTRH